MERRQKFRQGLSSLYLPYYDQLCQLLEPRWQPYQGFRSFSQQNALYAQGRTARGKIVTNARAGESAHCYGCATDWTLWDIDGNPIWLGASDPVWKEYIDAVELIGLKAGIDFGDIDHNEYSIRCSWPNIFDVYNKSGMTAAMSLIERMKS